MHPNVREYNIMKEMEVAGVVFNGGTNDRQLAVRYSRVGKTFTITRAERLAAYERGVENTLENQEVMNDLGKYFETAV